MPHSAAAVKVLLFYLVIINAVTFFLFALDKKLSRRGRVRIPERDLIFLSIIGGSPAGLLGVHLLRHKTRHTRFKWGLPVIFLLQLFPLLYFTLL